MDLLDTYKVLITVSGGVDAKGAPVSVPPGTFLWEAVEISGTFGTITPGSPDPSSATLFAGVGGATGYVKCTLTLTDGVTQYTGKTETIDIGVTSAVTLTLTLGTPEAA